MEGIPSLFSLCMNRISWNIMHGLEQANDLLELPLHLLDGFLISLPPLALQNIYELSVSFQNPEASTVNIVDNGKKRQRANLNSAWERFYKQRWPENIKKKNVFSSMEADHFVEVDVIDWQQLYWERHLQECLDAATEQALLPAFDCDVAELEIPGNIMSSIGHFGSDNCPVPSYCSIVTSLGVISSSLLLLNVSGGSGSEANGWLKRFYYANYIVIIGEKELLRASKLQGLVLQRITSRRHVDGVCKLINQHRENLEGLHLDPYYDFNTFRLVILSILGKVASPVCFADSHLRQKSAEAIFEVLIDSSHGLLDLEISGNEKPPTVIHHVQLNNIQNHYFEQRGPSSCVGQHAKLKGSLDLSANPIGDDGVRLPGSSRQDIRFRVEARADVKGVEEEFADAVKVTMGPKLWCTKVTKDGVTVAKSTTCATILTRAIFAEGCKSVAAGMNAMDLRRGIAMAVDAVVTNLKSRARMISTSEEIAQPLAEDQLTLSTNAGEVYWQLLSVVSDLEVSVMGRGGTLAVGGKGNFSRVMVTGLLLSVIM
ncbi:hypothetical protein HPP92_014830 [Vanilla planifolia]|uniref:Uncharacterized protein n=1 Tax=Vanilla planifolia TaxID=51239 RepID=A0A835UT39_VANPL|nr:hypothetical protein HPP92_014830 [Vanilla planifolia]